MPRRDHFLLDTNVLILLIRGGPVGRRIASDFNLYDPATKLFVSVVTVGEALSLGKLWGWDAGRLGMMRHIIDQTNVVDINTSPILKLYSEVDCHSKSNKGIKMGKNDVWIAATARERTLLLLTTDKDFEHLCPSHLERVLLDPDTGEPKASA